MPDDQSNVPAVDNSKLRTSFAGKCRMRRWERTRYAYYDDGGKRGRGNCTWGVGILAHHGPCTAEELNRSVSPAQVESELSLRVADAERIIRKRVKRQQLNQDQFDALVSFVYNAGGQGAYSALGHVDDGDFKAAAASISRTIYMTIKTKKASKRVLARGLIPRRAEESAPFRAAK